MVPDEFANFFVASAGVSGALIGLLFVASAVAPERILASHAPLRAQETAASAYLALIDTLFVALAALIPSQALAVVVPIMATVGIIGTLIFAGLTVIEERRQGLRWYLRRGITLFFFGWQLVLGIRLATSGANADRLGTLCAVSLAFYAMGISGAWKLLGGSGHGILDGYSLWRERHSLEVAEQEGAVTHD